MALALATLASAGLFSAAHATYPGENGVIVFETNFGGPGIFSVSPGNSAVAFLAPGLRPSVSPNGKKIAFLSEDSTTISVMNIDGSNVVELTKDQALRSPVWLPDGSKVVYGRVVSQTQVELWTINPDGSGKAFKRKLPDALSIGPLPLAWSPRVNMYTYLGTGGLYITSDEDPGAHVLAKNGMGSSWAPDGLSILFTDQINDQFEINPDGSNLRRLSPGNATQSASSISPDGQFIAGRVYNNGEDGRLATRARAGTPTTFIWPTANAFKTDWARVPENCEVSTLSGGGGVLAGDVDFYASQCAIAVMPDGGLHGVLQQAIAVGPDQRLYHRFLKIDPFGGAPVWSPFLPVPGAGGSPLGIYAKKIAIAASKDGSSQVVIINATNDLVYHAMRYANGNWSGFAALDGAQGAPNFAARDVAIAIGSSTPTSPGNAQVIANGLAGGGLYHRVRRPDGSWTSFDPITFANTHNIALAVGEDGNANVLATMTAADGSQGQIKQVLRYASGYWSDWGGVSVPKGTTISVYSDVAVTRTLSGTAQVMFTDAKGNAFFQERLTPNVLSSWQDPVSSPLIAKTVGRAVSISAGTTAQSSSQLLVTRTYPH